jgi:hypothetical protein
LAAIDKDLSRKMSLMLDISWGWRILVEQVCAWRGYLIVWSWLPGCCLEEAPL